MFPVEPSVDFVVHDIRGEGVDDRNMGMEDGNVGVEDSDVGVNDGHVDDGHMGDGHVDDGQMGVHDCHVDDGPVGDGHVGDNHKGGIHLGDGLKCDGHMGVGERHGSSWGHKTKLEELPDEILEVIIKWCLTGNKRTVVDTYSVLKSVNQRCRRIVSTFWKRLPSVSLTRKTYMGWNSMRKLSKQHGKNSGRILALREVIDSSAWIGAWVQLMFDRSIGPT